MMSESVKAYVRHAIKHGAATESGEYRKANKAYDQIVAAYRSIMADAQEGRQAMLAMLTHPDPSVRC